MDSYGDKIFIDFEKVCAIAHRKQALPLGEKLANCLDHLLPTKQNKAKHFTNSRIPRYQDIELNFLPDKAADLIDLN